MVCCQVNSAICYENIIIKEQKNQGIAKFSASSYWGTCTNVPGTVPTMMLSATSTWLSRDTCLAPDGITSRTVVCKDRKILCLVWLIPASSNSVEKAADTALTGTILTCTRGPSPEKKGTPSAAPSGMEMLWASALPNCCWVSRADPARGSPPCWEGSPLVCVALVLAPPRPARGG